MNKKILLESILKKRKSLENKFIVENSQKIFQQYQKSQSYFNIPPNSVVACYWAINNEVDTTSIINYIINNNGKVLLPSIVKDSKILEFREYEGNLTQGKFNIKESSSHKVFLPDIILAPLVAFDELGNRLGYGGGYYDATLRYYESIEKSVLYIGLAYDFQEVAKIDTHSFDVKLHGVITNKYYKYFDRV
ncbi:MAG: 5-formyltetrahydrofolate cyclo-ligase [Alphaproteobacteria bacterium]|jgi:5-formyltetrahydrofolate cyclo-ligase|nr:5-formyltetrahydrofolate cyclo-ligase [Alphaproteobacteria bacterium]